MDESDFLQPDLYFNQELSLLQFNDRVLELAQDPDIPLLERLRFVFIFSQNLDEFFEIRVAGIKQKLMLNPNQITIDGLTYDEVLKKISQASHALANKQYRILNDELLPALAEQDIHILPEEEWSPELIAWTKTYFRHDVLPVLTPIGLDLAHPFPRLVNKSLNFIVSLQGKDAFGRDSGLAIIHVPRSLPRLIAIPREYTGEGDYFISLSSLLQAYSNYLFPGMLVTGCYQFRLTRNSDLWVNEDKTDDLLRELSGKLPMRHYGDSVRLEISDDCPQSVAFFLLNKFSLNENDLYSVAGPVNLTRLSAILDLVQRPDLCYENFQPALPPSLKNFHDVFATLRKRDILLHHPYQDFQLVIDFIRQAATDPDVIVIKQTLYRIDIGSPMIDALVEAARAGKEVTAVVELRARFDEADNIALANRLQEAGVLVVYGVVGYKTHAKMSLIVRREGNQLNRYIHLGTGNYHITKAKQYVDFSLLTSDYEMALDVHYLFQQLTGMGGATKLKKLLHAPFTLERTLLHFIAEEINHAAAGNPARIIIKINALTDPTLITALYKASQSGVVIDLIVRGICCLRPGLPGISDNIRVRSILGRFLEHARVYYFLNNGDPRLYCASADCMERNFQHRVEVAFPIEDPRLARKLIREALVMPLTDNYQSWELEASGRYKRNQPDHKPVRQVQQRLLNKLTR